MLADLVGRFRRNIRVICGSRLRRRVLGFGTLGGRLRRKVLENDVRRTRGTWRSSPKASGRTRYTWRCSPADCPDELLRRLTVAYTGGAASASSYIRAAYRTAARVIDCSPRLIITCNWIALNNSFVLRILFVRTTSEFSMCCKLRSTMSKLKKIHRFH